MTPTMDPDILRKWIGRTETMTDTIRLAPAQLMEMTLDRDPVLKEGDALPPLWHWLYFLHSARLSNLGRDGHPALGGFLPPVALPRRMWAGGRFGFIRDLTIGATLTKHSTIKAVQPKHGRTGDLCFVTVRHEIGTDPDAPALWEEHDIVYRDDPKPGDAKRDLPTVDPDWPAATTFQTSEVQLFRYSALTFNGHRIHYDRDYARNVEGHQGLVLHGPLIAKLLAELAVLHSGGRPLRQFHFRAISPVYENNPISLHVREDGDGLSLVAAQKTGDLAMQATAKF